MTRLRCWPGCLAIVNANGRDPRNRGAIVEVVRLYGGEVLPGHDSGYSGGGWVVESRDRLLYTASGQAPSRTHVVRDASLTPITPPPGTDITDTPEQIARPAEVVER